MTKMMAKGLLTSGACNSAGGFLVAMLKWQYDGEKTRLEDPVYSPCLEQLINTRAENDNCEAIISQGVKRSKSRTIDNQRAVCL